MIRSLLYSILLFIGVQSMQAQQFYPIKIDQKWGLIDVKGTIILDPVYDAIGEFQAYNYAIVQQGAAVGLINQTGQLIVPIIYEDIKILDSTLIGVITDNAWNVVNLKGEKMLKGNYESVKAWRGTYLGFQKKGKWGIAHISGRLISSPIYDNITFIGDYFQTSINDQLGLIDLDGNVIINPIASDIAIFNDDLFFFKKDKFWGAVNRQGALQVANRWEYFEDLDQRFIKLIGQNGMALFSVANQKIITKELYKNFFPFQKDKVLARKYAQLCLLNLKGENILSCSYDEIKAFGNNLYRVRQGKRWGVINEHEKIVIPLKYDYISPLNTYVCIVRKGNLFGIVNYKGELVTEILYTKIKLNNNQVSAYIGKNFTALSFNEEGEIGNSTKFDRHVTIKIGRPAPVLRRRNRVLDSDFIDYTLDDFEWFYAAGEDKWGLRSIETGDIQIEPTYDKIEIKRELGFTVVGIEQLGRQKISRTNFRFNFVYGLVNNKRGLQVTDMNLWDIKLEDFEVDRLNVARCIFTNGKHGLIRKDGKIILEGYTYIGRFVENRAKFALRGSLSGAINPPKNHLGFLANYLSAIRSPNEMSDFTLFDQEFIAEAVLTCENCNWGYLDTTGTKVTQNAYQFAKDFKNGVGMVQQNEKWGLLQADGTTILDHRFDDIHFLSNTDQQILRVYINSERYGLIDQLGRAVIPVDYEDIGAFGEGLVPVKKNGRWGYADNTGQEVIPCEYENALPFHEGLAGVKKNRRWGFINKDNEVIIPIENKRVGSFKNGIAWVKNGFHGGYMDKTGKIIIAPQYEDGKDFEDGIARVKEDDKYGLINLRGDYILPPKYLKISTFDKHGLAITELPEGRRKYGLINRKGEKILSRRFHKIRPFSEGIAAIKSDNQWGFMDTLGNIIIEPQYSQVASFSEGRAAIRINGRWGFIDQKGNFILKPQFSKCLSYDSGKAVVYKGYRNAGLVDLDGNYVIEPSVYKMVDFSDGRGLVRNNNSQWYYITEENRIYKGYYQRAASFQDGVAAVKLKGKWGLINQKGIELISPKYDKVSDFKNGYAKVRIKRFTGIVNLKGEVILEPTFEYISYAGDGVFRVEQGDRLGYFNELGSWIWALAR